MTLGQVDEISGKSWVNGEQYSLGREFKTRTKLSTTEKWQPQTRCFLWGTAHAYQYFIHEAGLEEKLRQLFSDLDVEDVNNLRVRGKQARSLILNRPFPQDLQDAIAQAYLKLCKQYGYDVELCDRFFILLAGKTPYAA